VVLQEEKDQIESVPQRAHCLGLARDSVGSILRYAPPAALSLVLSSFAVGGGRQGLLRCNVTLYERPTIAAVALGHGPERLAAARAGLWADGQGASQLAFLDPVLSSSPG